MTAARNNPPKTHLAVFDIDGTLTDSVAVYQSAYLAALQPFEFHSIDADWGNYEHHTDSWIFQKIFEVNFGRLPSTNDCNRFAAEVEKAFSALTRDQAIREIRGAARFIEMLEKETDWAIAFATGSLRQPACVKLSSCDIFFQEKTLATASELFTRAEIVESAIIQAKEYYGQKHFDKIVSMGDGLWDFKTAQQMNLHFVGIGEGPKANQLAALGNKVFVDFQNNVDVTDYLNKLT